MSLTVDKNKKYDRQLRLWGDNGQLLLENSHICMIGCDAIGTEVVKNLILPGVGKVSIIDDTLVNINDLTTNFFVALEDVGKSKAQVTSKFLSELNDEVIVTHEDDSIESLLSCKPEYFTKFNIVVTSGLNNKILINLDRILYPENIPLIVCHSIGMFATVRVIVQEHNVLDSRPDNSKPDLRLDKPLKELIEFSNQQNFDSSTRKDIAHCPWLVVLHKYIELYKSMHGSWPTNSTDKIALKKLIKQDEIKYRRKKLECGEESDSIENFDVLDSFEEASKMIWTTVVSTEIPENVQKLLDDPRCTNVGRESRPFWILVRSLREFVSCHDNTLPLRGDIPDMISDTTRYIKLQHMYRSAALSHIEELKSYVVRLCQTFQIKMTDELSDENIVKFAKNCRNIYSITTHSLERELKTSPSYTEELISPDCCDELSWYLVMRAAISFMTIERRLPGQQQHAECTSSDMVHLRSIVIQELSNSPRWKGLSVKDEYLQEICRYRGIQLHSICAFIGGVVSQEVIKLLTGQYMPISQPLLYNGITQTTHNIDL